MIRNRDKADTAFALLIVVFGLYVAWSGIELSVGSLKRIGPGFFPAVLGTMIALLGAGVLFEDRPPTGLRGFNLRGLVLVSLAIAAFAFLAERAGLFPAVAALVLLVGAGSRDRPLMLATAALIAGICAVGYLLFDWALGLPLQPFGGALAAMRG